MLGRRRLSLGVRSASFFPGLIHRTVVPYMHPILAVVLYPRAPENAPFCFSCRFPFCSPKYLLYSSRLTLTLARQYALQYGYRLRPCFTFGESDTYWNAQVFYAHYCIFIFGFLSPDRRRVILSSPASLPRVWLDQIKLARWMGWLSCSCTYT